MLSITPCPNGRELAEAPGFEPGSRDPKPLMLSTTPCLLAVPSETAVALKVFIADSPVPLIDKSTAFTVGPFGYISDVLCAVHDVRPSSGIGVFSTSPIINYLLVVILEHKHEPVILATFSGQTNEISPNIHLHAKMKGLPL